VRGPFVPFNYRGGESCDDDAHERGREPPAPRSDRSASRGPRPPPPDTRANSAQEELVFEPCDDDARVWDVAYDTWADPAQGELVSSHEAIEVYWETIEEIEKMIPHRVRFRH
jgi:hypothetical protein